MKEATGELNMTVITVVAIAAVGALFTFFVWPNIQANLMLNTACSQVNSNGNFKLCNNYIYNDIIKLSDNNIAYISSQSGSEIITIILIKLLNNYINAIISYYEINIMSQNNLKIYRDITLFNLKGFLGIGMTNYNYTLNTNKTYSNYFIIGFSNIDSNTFPNTIDILSDENITQFQLKK